MNKIVRTFGVVVLSLLIFGVIEVKAQGAQVISFNAGIFNPKDSKAGFFGGMMFGISVDEAVDIGVSADIYRKTYTERTKVEEFTTAGGKTSTEVDQFEYSRTLLPVMLNLNVKVPGNRYGDYGYFLRGRLGYEWLFSKETNYETQPVTEDNRRYSGFGWGLDLGLYYRVGSRSTLTVSGLYNSCEVSKSKGKTEEGLPISDRTDVSGLGFQVGVHISLGR